MTERSDVPRAGSPHPVPPSDRRRAIDMDGMRRFRFEDLADGDRRIRITFEETTYELRLTRNGRLVLHK